MALSNILLISIQILTPVFSLNKIDCATRENIVSNHCNQVQITDRLSGQTYTRPFDMHYCTNLLHPPLYLHTSRQYLCMNFTDQQK